VRTLGDALVVFGSASWIAQGGVRGDDLLKARV
jgi:hypothetical protein